MCKQCFILVLILAAVLDIILLLAAVLDIILLQPFTCCPFSLFMSVVRLWLIVDYGTMKALCSVSTSWVSVYYLYMHHVDPTLQLEAILWLLVTALYILAENIFSFLFFCS
jgi:hypothetical protein